MTCPEPPRTLEESLADACRRILRGIEARRGPFHTPTLATRGADGGPNLRTVVLRAFDPAARSLRIHTDRRSAKAAELATDPRAMLHAYDGEARLQLRFAGQARLHLDDALADAAWTASREGSLVCYAAAQAPGTAIAAPAAAPRFAAAGRANFAVISLVFDSLDWLLLDPAGHRRARFAWDGAGRLAAEWIAP